MAEHVCMYKLCVVDSSTSANTSAGTNSSSLH